MPGKRAIRPFRLGPLSLLRSIWKQRASLVITWLLLSVAAAGIVHKLPSAYKADVIILVESQRIPQSFVSSTVDVDLRARLSTLSQQILSYGNLLQCIKKFDLYPQERNRRAQEEIVEMMKQDTEVQLEKGWSLERPGAFRITYRGEDPAKVALVANELGYHFIAENIRSRSDQADSTSEFLDSQLGEAKQRLEEQEGKLSAYKLQHNGELPEQQGVLLAKLSNLQLRVQAARDAESRAQQNAMIVDTSLRLAQESLGTVTELADTPANAAGQAKLDPAEESAKTADELQAELNGLLANRGPEHPAVRRLERMIAAARQDEAEERAKGRTPHPKPAKPKSALAVQSLIQARERVEQLRAQKFVIAGEIADRERELAVAQKEISVIQARLDQLPLREQEMASVMRDYQNSKVNYQSLLDKKLAARMAGEMERRQKAEHFSMLEPARTPEKPFRPDRVLFSLLGCAAALLLGTAYAVLRETRAGVFLGEWELPVSVAILARLPVIFHAIETPRSRGLRPAMITAGLLSLLAIAGTVWVVMGRS
jgi:polysaccharide chain length determinant protein (PEP-CTERM system associated)